jgi:hypothetical protein
LSECPSLGLSWVHGWLLIWCKYTLLT